MFTFAFKDVKGEQLLYLLMKTIVNLRLNWLIMYMYFQNVFMYFSNYTIFGQDSHGFAYYVSCYYFFFAVFILFKNKLPIDIGVILTVFYDIILLNICSTCISINLQRSVTTWKQFVAILCTNTEIFFII